jgi:HSP20 family protein
MWGFAKNLRRRISGWSRLGSDVGSGTDNARYLRVALPGIDPENVDVNVAGNTLHIRASERNSRNGRVMLTHFEELITLPEFVDTDKIAATFRHGLLELALPYRDEVKPRRIQIATGENKQLLNAA